MSTLGTSLSKILSPRQYSTLSISPHKSTFSKSPNHSGVRKRASYFQTERSHLECKDQQNTNNIRNSPVSNITCAKRLLGSHLQVPSNSIPLINSPLTKELAKKGVEGIASSNILGRGRFGTVIKGLYKDNPIAVKIIPKDHKNFEVIHKEENAVKLTHPNIVHVIRTLSSEGNYDIILMEYCNGANLLRKINDATFTLDLNRCIRYALDVGYALQHCHKNRIIHLDVKPENIVIDFEDHCKLCDFGSSRIMDTEDGVQTPWPGTPTFAAPEVLQGICVTCKADIYSLGITMWQMQSREPPYFGEDIHSVIYKAVKQYHRPRRIPVTAKEEVNFLHLYEKCWADDHKRRPCVEEVIESLLGIKRDV